MSKKQLTFIVSLLLFIGVCLFLFIKFPSVRRKGGLEGELANLPEAYLEEYSCFGIKRDFCPPWPDYGCDYLCHGFVYGKMCYIESWNAEQGEVKSETECR